MMMSDPGIDTVMRGFAFCEPVATLNAFFDDHYYPHVAATTRGHRHTALTYDKHLRDTLGPLGWADLAPLTVNAWLRRQVQAGLKNTTINKHIFLVNRLFRTVRDWGRCPRGPMRRPICASCPRAITGNAFFLRPRLGGSCANATGSTTPTLRCSSASCC